MHTTHTDTDPHTQHTLVQVVSVRAYRDGQVRPRCVCGRGTNANKTGRRWNQVVTLRAALVLSHAPSRLSLHRLALRYNFPLTFLPPWLNWKPLAISFTNCAPRLWGPGSRAAWMSPGFLPASCSDSTALDKWWCSVWKFSGSWLSCVNLSESFILCRIKSSVSRVQWEYFLLVSGCLFAFFVVSSDVQSLIVVKFGLSFSLQG